MLIYQFLPKAAYPKPTKSLQKHKMERLACCRKALKDNGLGSVSTDLAELEKDGARLGWQGHKGFAATCSIATALGRKLLAKGGSDPYYHVALDATVGRNFVVHVLLIQVNEFLFTVWAFHRLAKAGWCLYILKEPQKLRQK